MTTKKPGRTMSCRVAYLLLSEQEKGRSKSRHNAKQKTRGEVKWMEGWLVGLALAWFGWIGRQVG